MYRLALALHIFMAALLLAACGQPAPTPAAPANLLAATSVAQAKNVLISIEVGDEKDNGWGMSHHTAVTQVAKDRGWVLYAYQNLNPGNPNKPVCENVTEEYIGKARQEQPGGKILIRYNSDDFKDCAVMIARQHPDVFVEHISGDQAKTLGDKTPPNFANATIKNEYTAALMGCVAGVMTRSGKLSYLSGPVQPETIRLFDTYAWGAQVCGKGKPIEVYNLSVGFWFNIPGTTNDPTQLLGQAHALGVDGYATGIDTQDSLSYAQDLKQKGEPAFGFGWDYVGSCPETASACAGAPYLNWDTELNTFMERVERGTWKVDWIDFDPDWSKVFTDQSPTGFVFGPAITPEAKTAVQDFASKMASGKSKLLQDARLQDGTAWDASRPFYPDLWNLDKHLAGTRMYGGK